MAVAQGGARNLERLAPRRCAGPAMRGYEICEHSGPTAVRALIDSSGCRAGKHDRKLSVSSYLTEVRSLPSEEWPRRSPAMNGDSTRTAPAVGGRTPGR